MKYLVSVALVLTCCAGTVFAQAGSIVATSDLGGTDCLFVDSGNLVQVYIFHVDHPGATASQWKLDLGGLPWTLLGDQIEFDTVIGSIPTGISIGYGACETAPVYLGVASFFGSSAPACSAIRIGPDPTALSGAIEAVDCSVPAVKVFPLGIGGWVNSDGSCGCSNPPLPVEDSTWGQVKALYR
jgi:hypothetical protein